MTDQPNRKTPHNPPVVRVTTSRIDDGGTHHVVITSTGSATRTYIDGVLQVEAEPTKGDDL